MTEWPKSKANRARRSRECKDAALKVADTRIGAFGAEPIQKSNLEN
ncbi:MAG: hypothetical protein H6983_16390 [Ectothiorhodospiraceae bacterium]|nr:hypothetical protein [Ectothiorhodospiraceae bacterium]